MMIKIHIKTLEISIKSDGIHTISYGIYIKSFGKFAATEKKSRLDIFSTLAHIQLFRVIGVTGGPLGPNGPDQFGDWDRVGYTNAPHKPVKSQDTWCSKNRSRLYKNDTFEIHDISKKRDI